MGTRCANHVTPLYPQKFALTSPTGGGRSVGLVRSRTKATEFSFSLSGDPLDKSDYVAQNGNLEKYELEYVLMETGFVNCEIQSCVNSWSQQEEQWNSQNNQYSGQDLNTGITEYGVEFGYGQVPWNEKSGYSSET